MINRKSFIGVIIFILVLCGVSYAAALDYAEFSLTPIGGFLNIVSRTSFFVEMGCIIINLILYFYLILLNEKDEKYILKQKEIKKACLFITIFSIIYGGISIIWRNILVDVNNPIFYSIYPTGMTRTFIFEAYYNGVKQDFPTQSILREYFPDALIHIIILLIPISIYGTIRKKCKK